MKPPKLRFTEADSKAAFAEWKATCGPHSLAAATGKTLEEVRAILVNYKGWMSPTMVTNALIALNAAPFTLTKGLKTMNLCNGINRIQWEGPWLKPGVPARVAYFQTHLVAHFDGAVLCTATGLNTEWIGRLHWQDFHLNAAPLSPFHVTHHWAFARPT